MKRDGVNSNITFICNIYSYRLLAFSLLVVIVEVNMSILILHLIHYLDEYLGKHSKCVCQKVHRLHQYWHPKFLL